MTTVIRAASSAVGDGTFATALALIVAVGIVCFGLLAVALFASTAAVV
jgi:hypothetical protein